jgi:hypothetical protein
MLLQGAYEVDAALVLRAKLDVDDGRLVLPNKDEVYGSIEGTIAHFKKHLA